MKAKETENLENEEFKCNNIIYFCIQKWNSLGIMKYFLLTFHLLTTLNPEMHKYTYINYYCIFNIPL